MMSKITPEQLAERFGTPTPEPPADPTPAPEPAPEPAPAARKAPRKAARQDTRTHTRTAPRQNTPAGALTELWAASTPRVYLLARQLARGGRRLHPGRGVNYRLPLEIDEALAAYVKATPDVDGTAVVVALLDAFLRDQGADLDRLPLDEGGQA